MTRFLTPLLCLLLASCAVRGTAAQSQVVRSDGTISAGTRSTADGTTEPGRQEYVGLYLPLPMGFDLKASISGDSAGFPIIIGQPPAAQVAPAALRSVCAPGAQIETVEEEVTVMDTVQVPRTVKVQRQYMRVPVPQAAPRACPAPPVAQRTCPCDGNCCVLPEVVTVAHR